MQIPIDPKSFRTVALSLIIWSLTLLPALLFAEERMLSKQMHHLRIDGEREWDEFPETTEATRLEIRFTADANSDEQTLGVRQQDVKQLWHVRLNDKEIGRLPRDENDMCVYFAIPPRTLKDGENLLVISQDRGMPDDVRIGEIQLDSRSKAEVLSECTLSVRVTDPDRSQPPPARITILTQDGSLQTVEVAESPQLAVRPGTVYTANGLATFHVPAGDYVLYAGRGFEYSLASTQLVLKPGDHVERTLEIRREVPTEGYVACDPHVHTLTHSGHGDATVMERMISIAGEGIELPIATDHNKHIDHTPFAEMAGVGDLFTPVIGNEVTTPVGHFNIFPVAPKATVPNHQLKDWQAIFAEIEQSTHAPIVILNHARDLHGGIRPFGPRHFLGATGASTDHWPQRMNGMEVVNSGATQTDTMQLFHDWMTLLNRGVNIAPVGASDSHDVARHFVGQGRTYIRCDDSKPGKINVSQAVESFRQGRVLVSYGLLAELKVSGSSSGEVVPVKSEHVTIDARVLGPHWVTATQIDLYLNGQLIREQPISLQDDGENLHDGVKWSGSWMIPAPKHDAHLVAIAHGPGIKESYWATAKPYQPTSQQSATRVIGCSGAVWLDVDGDGKKTSVRDYAVATWKNARGDLPTLMTSLAEFDVATAAQAAEQVHVAGTPTNSPELQAALKKAAPHVQDGFARYVASWRDHEIALMQSSE